MMRLLALLLVTCVGIIGALADISSNMLTQTLSNPPAWALPSSALDLNFQNQVYYWNLGGSIKSALTVSRTTNETCTSQGGNLTYAGSGVACITDNGLQVWQAATNLLLQSQFAATWTATRSSVTSNAATSPDGTTNAATLIEDATATNTHLTIQAVTKAASALPYTFSVYGKTGTRTRIDLQLDDNAGNGAVMVCDLSGKQVGVTATGVGVAFTTLTSGVNVVGAWTRCWINATTNTATTLNSTVFLDSGSGTAAISNSYSGDGASGATIFGAQLEQNTMGVPSPYIPTTTVSATRNADNISLTQTFGTPNYVLYAQATPALATGNALSQQLLSYDDGTNNNRSVLLRVSGKLQFVLVSGASTTWNPSNLDWAAATTLKAVASYSAGAQCGALNGTADTAGTGAALPVAPTTLHIGTNAAVSVWWDGTIQRIAMLNGYPGCGVINLSK